MAKTSHPARVYTAKGLKFLVTAIGVGSVLVLPGSAVLLEGLSKQMDKKSASKTLSYLKYRKLVESRETKNGDIEYRLTDKGVARYRKIALEELSIKTPLNWDKKWRMVMFDIPVSRQNNTKRQYFVSELRSLDFMMLQKSAWIHPFDCKEQIGVLLDYFELDDYVSFFTIEDANFEALAVNHFKKIGLFNG